MLNANFVDHDQTLCAVASDLGLQCLPMSLLGDARHPLVNEEVQTVPQSQIAVYLE